MKPVSVSVYKLSKNIEYHNLNISLSQNCNKFFPSKKFACYDNSGVSKLNCDSRSPGTSKKENMYAFT